LRLRLIVCLISVALFGRAGVIKGVVLEQASGRPLARSVVRLQPVPGPGNHAVPLQTRAGPSGSFEFPAVPEGLYLIVATRDYYFPAGFGQRRPNGQGTPVAMNTESSVFAELRMRRMGVVTGRVLDENDIGMPDVAVVAYRARFPLHAVGRGISDDRGVYRIFNLEPGKYWVRNVAHTLDDGSGRLPTFGSEAMETANARLHEVLIDEETAYADLRPEPGRLFHLGGLLQCPPGEPVTVTLSSEIEHKSTAAVCGGPYQFQGLAPATYEIYAETKDGLAGFTEASVDRNTDAATVSLAPMPQVTIDIRSADTRSPANIPITLLGHRQDLSDLGKDQEIKGPRTSLAPGHWLMRAQVGPTRYVESIGSAAYARDHRPDQPSDAFDVIISGLQPRVTVMVSDRAGTIEGNVTDADSKPLPGAPVFLWPVTDTARRSIGGSERIVSDVHGHYTFRGLPPGGYRVLATFDTSEVDDEFLDAARATSVRLDIGQRTAIDLSLWIAP
jgi:Carboxypeptidase regulatory-like domain